MNSKKIGKMNEMVQNVNQRRRNFYACVLPEEVGKQGVFMSEEGYMPIISYAVVYFNGENLEIGYDNIVNGSIATPNELEKVVNDENSKIILFSDHEKEGGFGVKNEKFLLQDGDSGFAYVYIKCAGKDKMKQFLYVFDSSLENNNGKMAKLSMGDMKYEFSNFILKMAELTNGKVNKDARI